MVLKDDLAGVSNVLASLGHTGGVVLGHTLNTLRHVTTHKKAHNVLSKLMILGWAAFITILGCMGPAPGRLYTLVRSAVEGGKGQGRLLLTTSQYKKSVCVHPKFPDLTLQKAHR